MSSRSYEGLDIIVVDMTHGGLQLGKAYADRGAHVYAVDVHHTLTEDEKRDISSHSISLCDTFGDAVSVSDPSLVALQYAPEREAVMSFCGDAGIPLLTHARATGILLTDELKGKEVVEVTGACGKTSVVSLFSHVLEHSGRSQLVMNSRGIFYNDEDSVRTLDPFGSITPANALNAMQRASEEGIEPDTYVFEVSLGGLGVGNVAAVLNVPLHLKVGIMRSAFYSKCQMAEYLRSDSVLCLNGDDCPTGRMRHLTPSDVNAFSTYGADAEVRSSESAWYPGMGSFELEVSDLRTFQGKTINETMELNPSYGFFGHAGISNITAAATIALSLGIEGDIVTQALSRAEPIHGRLSSHDEGDSLHIRSTATSREAVMSSLGEAHDYALLHSLPLDVIVGGLQKTTCGYINFDALAQDLCSFMEKSRSLSIFGALGQELSKRGVPGKVYDSFNDARENGVPNRDNVVVSCVN